MPAFLAWPVIKAFFGGAFGKLWTWLSHRSFWQFMFGAALILAGWEYIGKRAEQRHATKVESQLSKAVAELNKISTERDTQKVVTKNNIVTVERIIHDAEGKARVVEQAPVAPGCKTKPEVLQADL